MLIFTIQDDIYLKEPLIKYVSKNIAVSEKYLQSLNINSNMISISKHYFNTFFNNVLKEEFDNIDDFIDNINNLCNEDFIIKYGFSIFIEEVLI